MFQDAPFQLDRRERNQARKQKPLLEADMPDKMPLQDRQLRSEQVVTGSLSVQRLQQDFNREMLNDGFVNLFPHGGIEADTPQGRDDNVFFDR